MSHLYDLQIHVNNQQTFFLNQKIVSTYSEKLKKIKNSIIHLHDFPGGPNGFELASRFCYNNGRITITPSNVSLLHCCAISLGMTEKVKSWNLLKQTDKFLQGMFDWSWNDVVQSLKSCESFFQYAESVSLIEKLIGALIGKIKSTQNSDSFSSPSSSSTSPESSESVRPWWFDDLTILPPKVIHKFLIILGVYGTENNSLIITKFLLHYLKNSIPIQKKLNLGPESDYVGLANTAIYGIILVVNKNPSFSCRKLLWVLRIVSNFGVSKDCRNGLEKVIGEKVDEATLDDLLVSGNAKCVYDVNLVVRLIKIFVNKSDGVMCLEKLKKVGRLTDEYLGEIAADQNLKISKFIRVADSIPDFGRDCYDQVYRAIDIYLERLHPTLSMEDRSRLCKCLNYHKLTLHACKDLAKNPRVPPEIAIEALMSKQSIAWRQPLELSTKASRKAEMVKYKGVDSYCFSEENEGMRLNLQRMQWRVAELENVCRDMNGKISRTIRHGVVVANSSSAAVHEYKSLPRLC